LSSLEPLEAEIKKLVIETLMLEDVSPEEIASEDALFGEGLGLDSIDALELAIALENRYGVTVEAEAEQNAAIFESVRSLATFVQANRSD
jgi:acyl carrier protein